MRDKKKKLLGYRVRIPFDGQHNRDNQNGFIRFTKRSALGLGNDTNFFQLHRNEKNGIFSTREKTALTREKDEAFL